MTSWNRRIAVVERVQQNSDPAAIAARLESYGVPAELHPDDVEALFTLMRLADNRPGYHVQLVGRVVQRGGVDLIRLLVSNENDEVKVLIEYDDDDERDNLTGLPLRHHAVPEIDRALQTSAERGHQVAVFTVDLDRFKHVNDSLGFTAGDNVLRSLARVLQDQLRPDDALIRMGGDEFVVVSPGLLGVAEAAALGERLRTAAAEAREDLHGRTLSVGIVIGGADRSGEQMLRAAETAGLQAKINGRDRCELFDDDMNFRNERRLTVDQRLRGALDHGGINVQFQPIVDIASRRIVGVEALLRLTDENGERLDPRELVDAAEDTGLIRRVEDRVIEQAADVFVDLVDKLDEPPFLAVNISDRRLSDSRFPLMLARTLHATGLPAEHLRLEISPSALTGSEAMMRLVNQLRALGIRLTIDEFTGAGDLDLLGPDRVDLVKLHRHMIGTVGTARGHTSVRLVNDGLRDLGVQICAVGVESNEDLDRVQQLGCHLAQGYLFTAPVDAAALVPIVTTGTY